MPELKLGSSDANTGGQVTPFQQWFERYARSYAPPVDGYIGNNDQAAIRTLQSNLVRSGASLVIDGKFGDRTAAAVGYKWKGAATPPVVTARRKIWFYSAPGSGADYWVGPSHEVGEIISGKREKNLDLHINHQPLYFQKGGYLGALGGDPKFSYNEVIYDEYLSLKACLDINPDWQEALAARRVDRTVRVEVEGWFSGYSQSAHGMLEAVLKLFGDGGPYELLRDRINGLILFGNPATPITGIAHRTYPTWLNDLMRNINKPNDFYAVAPDMIRRNFFDIIVEAEMELPFFIHVLKIAGPVILGAIPFLGMFVPFLGPLAPLALGTVTGLTALMPVMNQLVGTAQNKGDEEVDRRLIEMLSLTGIINNIPGLIGLVASLPGLQAHGDYGAADVGHGYDIVAQYRRS